MNELSLRTRMRLDGARTAGGATPADRERVFASVASRVGLATTAGTLALTAPSHAAAATASSSTLIGLKLAVGLAFVSAVGTAAVVVHAKHAHTPSAPVHHAAVRARTVALPPPGSAPDTVQHDTVPAWIVATAPGAANGAPDPVTDTIPGEMAAIPSRPSARAHAVAAHSVSIVTTAIELPGLDGTGSEETEAVLLREARDAIGQHDPRRAFSLLERLVDHYPQGALREERDAMRVHALCGLGATEAAARAARGFAITYPHSAFAALAHGSCARDTR